MLPLSPVSSKTALLSKKVLKLLYVKTVISKVVRQKWLVGHVPFYAKIWPKLHDAPP